MDFYKYITSYLTDGTKSFLKLDQNKIFQNNTNKFLLYSRTLNKIDFIDTLKLKNLGSENNRFNYLYANLGSDIHADYIYSNWTSDIFTATDNILTLNGSSKWLLYSDNSTLFNIYKDTKNNLKFNIVNSVLNFTNSNIAQLTSNIEKSTNIKTNNLILKEYPIKSTNEIPSKTENAICQWEKIDNGVLDTKILDREFLNNCSFNDDSLISNIKQSYYLEKPIKYQYKKADLKIFFNSSSGTYTMSSQNNNITISGTSYIIDGVSYSPTINKTDYPAGYNDRVTYTGSDNPSEATSSTKYNWKSTYADTSTNLKYYTLTGETETSTNSNTYNITDILIKPVVTIKSSTSKPSGGTVTFDITNNNNVRVVAHYYLTIVGVSTSAIYTTDVPAHSVLQDVICTFSGYQGNKVAIITLYFTASDCVTSDGVDASTQLPALTVASSEHTLKKYTYLLKIYHFGPTIEITDEEDQDQEYNSIVNPASFARLPNSYEVVSTDPSASFRVVEDTNISLFYRYKLKPIVITSASMISVRTLRVRWSSSNAIACSGHCYVKYTDHNVVESISFAANSSGYTDISVDNYSGSAYIGAVSSTSGVDSGVSNTVYYIYLTYSVTYTSRNSSGTTLDVFTRSYRGGDSVDCTLVGNSRSISGYDFSSASPTSYSNLNANQTCTLTYTAKAKETIHANGSSTLKVGSTNNIYVSDASGKAIGGITVYSSDTSIFTVSLSSGTLYHVTGVSSGSAKLKCSASGYNDLDVTINVQSASLAAPTASDVTASANEIDQSLTITDFSFTLYNSNNVGVSYTLALDIGATNTLNHSGTISANSSKVINLNASGDYSSFQGSLSVTFTAGGYESSTLDEQVQA